MFKTTRANSLLALPGNENIQINLLARARMRIYLWNYTDASSAVCISVVFFLVLWLIRFSSDTLPTWQYLSYQLQRQVLEENLIHNSIVIMQKNSAHFEKGIIQSTRSMFDEWRARASLSSNREWI